MYAAGGLNAFVCNTIFLGFDQFSFWSRAWAHAPTLGFSSTRSSPPATPRCPGLGALCFNVDGTPAPGIGPWKAGAC
jgi:hypothetical protein